MVGVWLLLLMIMLLATSSVSLSAQDAAAAEAPSPEEEGHKRLPLVISTWGFVDAVRAAWEVVDRGGSPVDAVEEGCSKCEKLRCDGSVGYGGSPDENGETTLDAMIMDGTTMDVGAVGALRSVKDAIGAARLVMDHSEHTLLVGDQASAFAMSLGLPGPANLSTDDSLQMWSTWRDMNCQPNFWRNVVPDASFSCGPYHVAGNTSLRHRIVERCENSGERESNLKGIGPSNHDTISMAVISKSSKIAAGTSTNGAKNKIPGRVGDGPIVGASAYADDDVGACGATGDGDIMMRFLPCYQVVESMRQGMSPKHAARDAIARIRRKYPLFIGAVFAVSRHGAHAGACNGWTFQYTVRGPGMEDVEIHTISPR